MKRTPLRERVLPVYTKGEEIFNMVSHIAGGVLGIVATVLCVAFAVMHRNVYGVVSGAIFGATMIVLYTMSSIYHGLSPKLPGKKVFQVIDHCSIYLLIAGTYTPFSLCTLRPVSPVIGWSIFGIVWGMAVLGIVLNSIDLEAFKIFSMCSYLGMGWCIVAAAGTMIQELGGGGTALLLSGGVAYTVGAVFYAFGRRKAYIHSVFHLFVCLGSFLHFFCILLYVM